MTEYKVFIYKESIMSSLFFSNAKVNEKELEDQLNKLASQGWILKTMERKNRRSLLFSSREAFIFIFEKNIK